METGYYKKRTIDWRKWEVDVFNPHLFLVDGCGCGASALATLTGVPPQYIHNTNKKNRNHWKDSYMIKFLKICGFKVHHLTKCDVSNTDISYGYASESVTDRHVLLMSQLMNKNSASWTIAHNKLWYHNFQTCSFSPTSILSQPTLSCYLILHPSWRRENWVDHKDKKLYS
jgi:hypothetical protein